MEGAYKGSEERGAICPLVPSGPLRPLAGASVQGLTAWWFCGPWQVHLDTVSIHIMQLLTQAKAREAGLRLEVGKGGHEGQTSGR